VRINALFSDFDGTLSPINVSREAARPSQELEEVLIALARLIPFAVVTTKDYNFIADRVRYAHAYACVGGLEIIVGGVRAFAIEVDKGVERTLLEISSMAREQGFLVEEKRLTDGTLVGISIDWRGRPNLGNRVDDIVSKAESYNLVVYRSTSPYVDVYVAPIDKGVAVRKLKELLGVKSGVMYMGDSPADVAAFREADVSIGVLHEENMGLELGATCVVLFNEVVELLRNLLANNLEFSVDLCPRAR